MDQERPRVSLIIACRDVARFIDDALWSARRQTVSAIEIVAVDDGSVDQTRERLRWHAEADPRVVVIAGGGHGPGAARNLALAVARGDWVAVLDGDDILHPRRLEILLDEAERNQADIVADNLLAFYPGHGTHPPHLLLAAAPWRHRGRIDLAGFIRHNQMFGKDGALGYLKPLIRRGLIERTGGRYDESLRIAEDYDFIARLLAAGARFHYFPGPLYFYRRHASSTSFRLHSADLTALIDAARRLHATLPPDSPEAAASATRWDGLSVALAFTRAVEALKARRILMAGRALMRRPAAIPLLTRAIAATLWRRLPRPRRPAPTEQGGGTLAIIGSEDAVPPLRHGADHPPRIVRVPAVGGPLFAEALASGQVSGAALALAATGPVETIIAARHLADDFTPFVVGVRLDTPPPITY